MFSSNLDLSPFNCLGFRYVLYHLPGYITTKLDDCVTISLATSDAFCRLSSRTWQAASFCFRTFIACNTSTVPHFRHVSSSRDLTFWML